MRQESINFLEEKKPVYDMLVKAGIVVQLDGATRQGILNVIREEWDPGYLADLWCAPCVQTMIRYAYTQYEKYLKNQKTI